MKKSSTTCIKTTITTNNRLVDQGIRPGIVALILCLLFLLMLTGCGQKVQESVKEKNTQKPVGSQSAVEKQNLDESLKNTVRKQLAAYGFKITEMTFDQKKGFAIVANSVETAATTNPKGDAILFQTTAVNQMMKRLAGDLKLQIQNQSPETSMFPIKLNTDQFVVEYHGDQAMPVLFRSTKTLETDVAIEKFVGSEALVKQWLTVLKGNGAIQSEKKYFCDIIVRRSGEPLCRIGDLLFSMDGKSAYMTAGNKLMSFPNFEEVKEQDAQNSNRLLFGGGKSGYALFQSQTDNLLTLIALNSGKIVQLNPFVAEHLIGIETKVTVKDGQILNLVFLGTFEGETHPEQAYLVIRMDPSPSSGSIASGKATLYKCPEQQGQAFADTFINPRPTKGGKPIKNMKEWMDDGLLEKVTDNVVVRKE